MKNKLSNISSSLITYFVMMASFILIRVLFLYIKLPFSESIKDLIVTLVVQGFFMFFLSFFIFSKLKKQSIKTTLNSFGYNKIKFLPIIISIFIGILCYILNIFIASFFSNIISLFGFEGVPTSSVSSTQDYSVFSFILQTISVAIIPAICEETAHRGLLLKGLSGMGIVKAIILSSVLFGLMHLNINQFFYATVLGFIIALSAVISKSIIPAIIIHFMNNFLSTYLSFASHNQWFLGDFQTRLFNFLYSGNLFSYILTLILTLTFILLLLVFLFYLLLKETRIKQTQKTLLEVTNLNKDYLTGGGDRKTIDMYQIGQLMAQYNIKSLNSMIFTDIESKGRKTNLLEKVLLFACFAMGIIVTLSTFIWGIL